MVEWPIRRPQVIRNFPFSASVAAMLRTQQFDPDKAGVLARDICDRLCAGEFTPALQSVLDCMYTIDDVKVRTTGQNASTQRSNMLIQFLGDVFVGCRQLESLQLKRIESLRDQTRETPGFEGWFYPKLESMLRTAKHILQTRQYVASLRIPRAVAMLASLTKVSTDVGRLCRDVMAELHRLRQYGIKSSYFEDGILHGPGDAWVMIDTIDLSETAPNMRAFLGYGTAFITLAERRSITSLDVNPVSERTDAWQRSGMYIDLYSKFDWILAPDGELYVASARKQLPVRAEFARMGREYLYELVRLSHILRLYDLVVPIDRVAALPSLPRAVRGFGVVAAISGALKLRQQQLVSPELVVPRVRLLEHPDALRAALDEELDKADHETQERTRRRHDVVAHIRRLPEGHKPSAKCRARAQEYGIVLKENETFIKKHERGTGEKVQATRAIHREGFGPR